MSFPRRPNSQKPKPQGGGRLPDFSVDEDNANKPKPKQVGWNGGRELPPMPFLAPEQEVGAEIAVRATENAVGTAVDATGAAVRGVFGDDELEVGPRESTEPGDPFAGPGPRRPGSRKDAGRGGKPQESAQGRLSRLAARSRGAVGRLAPFTLPEKPAVGPGGVSSAAGGVVKTGARRMARRAGSAALGSIPTLGRLRVSGNGSILMGMRVMANRNPIYRYFLSRLPLGGKAQMAVAAGCGCSTGCGCGSSCCSCAGCFWPIIIIFIVIGMSGVWAERQPGFIKPLFCERTTAAFCSSDGTSLTVQIDDLPSGSVEDYQAVEAETGVPWFYLAAWEKVATDFGRADFTKLAGAGGTVPGTALDATYAHLAQTVDSVLNPDGIDTNLTAEAQKQAEQAVEEHRDLIARLTSTLRGGNSFGLMLVSTAEYEKYGQKPDGTWRDPWDRKEASQIIAYHLRDIYNPGADVPGLSAGGSLTYDGAPDIGLLDKDTENWIHQQLLAIAADPAKAPDFDRFLQVIGRAGLTPDCVSTYHNYGGVRCTQPTDGIPIEKWWDGPHANLDITKPERFYVCQQILPEDEVSPADPAIAGACDSFLAGANTLEVDPALMFDEVVASYYDRDNTILPGTAVSDWGKLQILMGALLTTDPEWGADQIAYYLTNQITPDGKTGEKERVNAYAQAIVRYGRSVYESWSEAQIAARSQSGAGRAEAAALFFWNPPVNTVAKESGFPAEFLLATLKADGAFGCLPGQGVSVPDAVTTDWMDPLSLRVGKSMAKAMEFTGELTWIPLAAQMQWENGGDVKGNNPYNMADDSGHANGRPTYASRGQTGWWYGGNAVEHHWFAVFDTLDHGAAVSADLYLRGLTDQDDWRGYGAVVKAGRSGDPLATAIAIEASRWSSNHYGGNHILPPTGELWQKNKPERNGKIVRSVAGVQVATIGGCWRFGPGDAAPWTPPAPAEGQSAVSGNAIAMNFCIATVVAAPGGCGTATVTANGRSVTVPVAGFWDGDVGEAGETIAGLNGGAQSALGLSGSGTWPVSITLHKPAEATWPPEAYEYATPLDAVRALANELRSLANVAAPTVPNLGQLAPAWRIHSACVIDRTQAMVQVTDPWTAGVSYQISPWCQYLSDVIRYTTVFVGGASGGNLTTLFGVQAVSRFGYIWPIVGTHISSGFEPRSFGTNLNVTYSGHNTGVHTGLDLSPSGCNGQVVVDKSGWLYTKVQHALVIAGGKTYNYDTTVVFIDHADGLTSSFAHVNGNHLDPDLAAAMQDSTTTKHGHKAIFVQQGVRITSLDDIGCHTHYQIDILNRGLPFTYAYGGDAKARWTAKYSFEDYLSIDALQVLPWDPKVLKNRSNGKPLPAWYYSVYGPDGLPPAFVPSKAGL